ncbi:dynein light chain Tctex-type 5-B-like [Ylistrum balloti]|uniref:dynein light chain Tctex-type 5-B-like n=1 Tax=Ylistrum balloti TaxID=509963 RepID=UPI002905DB1D|nr:dynein light chain Tctex-type 5-B-like [Ylistrum balloti]
MLYSSQVHHCLTTGFNTATHHTMSGRPLGAKVSSFFDIPEKRIHAAGSSVISYACDPSQDDTRSMKKVFYENTYQLDPPKKFRADKITPIIQDILNTNLEGRKYDAIECSLLSKSLAEEIKLKVKELNFKRYKTVCMVTIGQKNDQGVRIGSRYLWDHDRDNYAAASFHNKHIFAVGTVYAVYFE